MDLFSTRRVGFTGSHRGMTRAQAAAVEDQLILALVAKPVEFHHGDCVGADAEAHAVAKKVHAEVHGHPPVDSRSRAFCDCDVLLSPKPYLTRNHTIVDAVDVLIAAPGSEREILRSGTWATIRYAKKKGILVVVVRPDGSVERIT